MADSISASPLSTTFLSPVETMQKVFLLKSIPLFEGLNAQQVVPVTEILTEVCYEEGDIIVNQGDDGHALYIVVSGLVELWVHGRRVSVLGPKEAFGEVAILDRAVHDATVKAREDVVLYAIARDDFQDLFDLNPTLSWVIIQVLVERLRVATSG